MINNVNHRCVIVNVLRQVCLISILLINRFIIGSRSNNYTILVRLIRLFNEGSTNTVCFERFPFRGTSMINKKGRTTRINLVIYLRLNRRAFLGTFIRLRVQLRNNRSAILLTFRRFVNLVSKRIRNNRRLSMLPKLIGIRLMIRFAIA